MALLGRTEIGVRDIGTAVLVPSDPKAKLMFYLSCVASVLDIGDKVPRRLTSYAIYNQLSDDEVNELLAHCLLFSPDVLKDQCFFQDDSPGISNKFLELSSVQSSMLIAGGIVIGGQNTRVAKIMTYTRRWITTNYEEPMVLVLAAQILPNARPAIRAAPATPQVNNSNNSGSSSSCCCVVM